MERRAFLELVAAAPLASTLRADTVSGASSDPAIPAYHVVSSYAPAAAAGMPGPWPGRVVSVRSARCLDAAGLTIDADVVRGMMDRGMRGLTGEASATAGWRRLFEPADVVGIKVNAGGHPWVVSSHAIVAETVRQLMALGIPVSQITVFERF